MTDTPELLSDRELLDRCERYGREALTWRNKFRALLPEVARRKLYLQKGCSSIYVFGKILAGLSEEQVSASLNIMPRLRDKPTLKKLLESGEVSINKITPVMSLATTENEAELAGKVQVMSLGALKTFARDMRMEMCQESDEAEFLVDKKPESNSLFVQDGELRLDEDVRKELMKLQEKGINISEIIRTSLAQRAQGIKEKKEEIVTQLPEAQSRHIPTRVKVILKEEYGTKCARQTCSRPAQQLHHTARYALTKSHNPFYLAPLCREHHEIAHAIDINVQECKWKK